MERNSQEPKQPNPEYVKQSLINQNADQALKIAEREAAITELQFENHELKKELEELRKQQIDEMDAEKTS